MITHRSSPESSILITSSISVHRIVRAYHNHGNVQMLIEKEQQNGKGKTAPRKVPRCDKELKTSSGLLHGHRQQLPNGGASTPLKLGRPPQRRLRKAANPPTRGSLTAILRPAPRPPRGVEIRRRGGGRGAGFWKVLDPAEAGGWPERRFWKAPRSGGGAGRPRGARSCGAPATREMGQRVEIRAGADQQGRVRFKGVRQSCRVADQTILAGCNYNKI